MPYRPIPYIGVAAGVAIAVASPIVHGRFVPDCSPHFELCGVSETGYWPDEQAPQNAPGIIFAPPVASYTSSAPSSAPMLYQFKTTSSTWVSDSSG
jgi:hypothetical protein